MINKNFIKGIFFGLLFVFLVSVLISITSFSASFYLISNLSAGEFSNFLSSTNNLVFHWILGLIGYTSLIFAGVIAAKVSRASNLLIGAILGVLIKLIPVLINLSILIVPVKFWIGSSKLSPDLIFDCFRIIQSTNSSK